jgi:hypothetical protein
MIAEGMNASDRRKHRLIQEIAYREAGRAVASWSLLLKFKYISISPSCEGAADYALAEYPKCFRPDMEITDQSRCAMERHIIVCRAGQYAQMKFRRKRPGLESEKRDVDPAGQMALRVCGFQRRTTEAYLRYCSLCAEDLVNKYWRPIELVAAALQESRMLSRYSVSQVIYQAGAGERAPL